MAVYHLHGETGSSTVCANGKQNCLMVVKFRSDWPLKKKQNTKRDLDVFEAAKLQMVSAFSTPIFWLEIFGSAAKFKSKV